MSLTPGSRTCPAALNGHGAHVSPRAMTHAAGTSPGSAERWSACAGRQRSGEGADAQVSDSPSRSAAGERAPALAVEQVDPRGVERELDLAAGPRVARRVQAGHDLAAAGGRILHAGV